MTDIDVALTAILVLFILVLSGVHISFALLGTSVGAMVLLGDLDMAISLLANSAYHAIFDYVFAVVPLFILMGSFMTQSRAAEGLYTFLYLIFRRVRGGLGVATVFSNAVFAAVSGTSVAAAAVFSKIALPQMYRYGYSSRLALGCVSGSSVLGMLIPPSLLMIIYGILTQTSIGALFIGGIIPGVLLATIYAVGIIVTGYVRPQSVGAVPGRAARNPATVTGGGANAAAVTPGDADADGSGRSDAAGAGGGSDTAVVGNGEPTRAEVLRSILGVLPVVALVVLVIGGIWGGLFTPTEASAVGALGAFVVGKVMGMSTRGVFLAFKEAAVITGAIMILLVSAQMYSRMLASSGLVSWVGDFLTGLGVGSTLIVIVFLAIVLLMGSVLDSASIILLAVPVIFPTIGLLGVDPLWFGVVVIVAVELGLLTPPFGMVPFTMSAVLGRKVRVEDIFIGGFPFFLMMILLVALMFIFPGLVTWLPSLM